MAALILLGLMSPLPALADCTSPVGVEADMYYNTTFKRVQYCDGTNWVNMGVSNSGPTDNLGNHTATQALAMANFKITGLATPTVATDAVTKAYVDGLVGGGDNLGDHIATTVLRSDTHNTDDLGTTAIRWKDGWFAGAVTAGSFAGVGTNLTALNATNLGSGTVPTARLGSGTANATTYLRGDGTWATPSSALPALTSANIWVGNGSNVATAVAMSGDATITNAGVVALAANSVTTAEILDSTIASADIAAGAVTTSEILDATILTADLADNSVTVAKIVKPGTTTTFLRGDGAWATPTAAAVAGTICGARHITCSGTTGQTVSYNADSSTASTCNGATLTATCSGGVPTVTCPSGYTAVRLNVSFVSNGFATTGIYHAFCRD